MSASDYELEYITTLNFDDGRSLAIKAKAFGEGARSMIRPNANGHPT